MSTGQQSNQSPNPEGDPRANQPPRWEPDAASPALRYDAFYRDESPFREIVGESLIPWDIGTPQPELVELERSGAFRGDVLDAGCGTADNAFFLHDKGYRVTGFDGSPHAIAQARQRARRQNADIAFVVADATELDGLTGQFDTVLDSALYHCLDATVRQSYLDSLHRVCRPGGTLHLLCFSDVAKRTDNNVNHISEGELRDVLSTGWRITTLRPARYLTAFTERHVALTAGPFGYDGPDTYLRSEFNGSDEHGRLYTHASLVSAERR